MHQFLLSLKGFAKAKNEQQNKCNILYEQCLKKLCFFSFILVTLITLIVIQVFTTYKSHDYMCTLLVLRQR